MPNVKRPRKGTLQYWPRKRTRRFYTRIRTWAATESLKFLGFAGYKVGMTHIIAKSQKNPDPRSNPATIIECPPLKPLSLRFYKKTPYGLVLATEVYASKLDKELAKKIRLPKKQNTSLDKINIDDYYDIRLQVYTQPRLTSLEKKKPEIFEIGISGKSLKERFEYAKSFLDKEIKVTDVFKDGQFIDVHSVTKGKGFAGTIKRWGASLRQKKSEKGKRSAVLGSFTPGKVMWGALQTGNLGLGARTEYNKQLLQINTNNQPFLPNGGFSHYGAIKNDYILLKGSVPGSTKRLIRLVDALRNKQVIPLEINYVDIKK